MSRESSTMACIEEIKGRRACSKAEPCEAHECTTGKCYCQQASRDNHRQNSTAEEEGQCSS